jgi:predicted transcriptional regulator
MPDNTLSTNTELNRPEPKYRKKLNEEQVAVLQLLWRFRFASNEQIAKYQQKPNSKAVQKRLKILEDQGLIAKRYDKSYKLQGKPAAYYLTPRRSHARSK